MHAHRLAAIHMQLRGLYAPRTDKSIASKIRLLNPRARSLAYTTSIIGFSIKTRRRSGKIEAVYTPRDIYSINKNTNLSDGASKRIQLIHVIDNPRGQIDTKSFIIILFVNDMSMILTDKIFLNKGSSSMFYTAI